jgi:ADP-ribosyl-[dinitrogen reductase] hydrolase
MIASPPWDLGEYTDDTQMALLLADSLLQHQRVIPTDLARRFHNWKKTAKDVGILTRNVLHMSNYAENPELCAARYYEHNPNDSAGNGAVMRCAPVALFCLESPQNLIEYSRSSARVTHYDPIAQSSCIVLNIWLSELITNQNRRGHLTATSMLDEVDCRPWQRLKRIEEVSETDISSSGFSVHTLEAAAWSFLTTTSFEDAVVRAANLGDDADTVAAVCGALAGCYYGYSEIPARWRAVLKDEQKIAQKALALASAGKALKSSGTNIS